MTKARLSEIARLDYGYAFDSKRFNTVGRGLPLVRIRDVVPGRSDTYYSGDYAARYIVNDGDYLIGMDGQFNLARWQGGTALLNQRVCRVGELDGSLDRGYLARFLPLALKRIEDATPFVTVKHLSAKALNAIQVPLPPLSEQRRIAAILDRADAIRSNRSQLLSHLDELAQELYQELIGTTDWPRARLRSITSKVGSGATPRGGKAGYSDEGVALIRSMNVHDGRFVWKDLAFLNEIQADALSNVTVEADDVLLNITGASVARVCRAPESAIPARVNQHVAIVRPMTGTVHPRILERYLLSRGAKRHLLSIAGGGATREAITKSQILELEVPVPSQDAQERYVRAASVLDAMRTTELANIENDHALFASLQFRAFRGDL